MHTHILSHILILTHMPVHVPQHACKGQRTTLGIQFFPSAVDSEDHTQNGSLLWLAWGAISPTQLFFALMASVKIPSLGV